MDTALVIIILIGLTAIGLGSWFNRKSPHAIPGVVLAVAVICVYAIFLPDLLKDLTTPEQTVVFLITSVMLVLAFAVILYLACNIIFKKFYKNNKKSKASISKIPGARVATVSAPKKRPEERKIDPSRPISEPHPELKQLNERVFGAAGRDQVVKVKKTRLIKLTAAADIIKPKTKKSNKAKSNLKTRLIQDHPKVVLVEPELESEELIDIQETEVSKEDVDIDNDKITGAKKKDGHAVKPENIKEPEIIKPKEKIIADKQEKPEEKIIKDKQEIRKKEEKQQEKDSKELVAAVLPDKNYKPTFVRKMKGKHSGDKDKDNEIKIENRRKDDDGDNFIFPNSRLESGEIAVDLRARVKKATEYSELDEMKLIMPEVPAELQKSNEKKDIPPSDVKTAFAYKANKEFEKAILAFEGCMQVTDDIREKKQIELEILDTLIRMERYSEATGRVFNIISSGYELNSVEKARLVNIMRILENQT